MLLVLIILSGVAIREEGRVVTDGFLTVDATGWRAVAGWIIFVSSVAIVLEATMLIVRYLNPSCINNNYGACGGLVRKSGDSYASKIPLHAWFLGYYKVCSGWNRIIHWMYHYCS